MKIACPACRARFRLDAHRATRPGVKGRCGECNHVFHVDPPGMDVREIANSSMEDCLLLDLEAAPDGRIFAMGAILGDETFERTDRFNFQTALADLERFGQDATFVLGHRILQEDRGQPETSRPGGRSGWRPRRKRADSGRPGIGKNPDRGPPAYLLRVRRLPSKSVLVLLFNHGAALSVRRQLRDLVGRDAAGVTVLTYHGLGGDALPELETGAFRRYEILGLGQLYLDFAGCRHEKAPVHHALSKLNLGDNIAMRDGDRGLELADENGLAVARLSRSAEAQWRDRIGDIETVTVIAMVRRQAKDAKPDFRGWPRCGVWEVPVVEVISRC